MWCSRKGIWEVRVDFNAQVLGRKEIFCKIYSHFSILFGVVPNTTEEESNLESQLLVFASDTAFF